MMKKMLLTMAVVALVIPAAASAQTVTATATVAQHSAVTGTGDLAFGTVDRSAGATIDAANGTGAAIRTVEYNHNVTVTFTAPTNLTSGTNNLPVSITCSVQAGQAGSYSAQTACNSASYALTVGTALTRSNLGFGGSITGAAASNAVAGSYSGTITINVAPTGS